MSLRNTCKGIFTALFALLSATLGLSALSPAQAADPNTGTIKAVVRLVPHQVMDEYNAMNQRGYSPNAQQMVLLQGVPVQLLDENNNVLATATTSYRDQYIQNGSVEFSNVPYGTYRLRVDLSELDHLELFPYTVVAQTYGEQHSLTSEPITLSAAQPEVTEEDGLSWPLIFKSVGVSFESSIGHFGQNESTKKLTYFPDGGGLVSVNAGGNTKLTYVNGVIYTSSLAQMSLSAPQPVLNQKENAYGYKFLGWTLGNETLFPDTATVTGVLSDADVAGIQAYPTNKGGLGDMHFKAVWSYPVHTLRFATDEDKGVINVAGQETSYADLEVRGNTSTLASTGTNIPTVTAKEGYEFIGWFDDMTTNIVSNDHISSMPIFADKTYYAKYRPIVPEPATFTVTFKEMADGVIVGDKEISVKDGKYIPELPRVRANEGKVFTGWRGADGTVYPDGFTLVANNLVRQDLVFEAVYEDAPPASEGCGCNITNITNNIINQTTKIFTNKGAKYEGLTANGIKTNGVYASGGKLAYTGANDTLIGGAALALVASGAFLVMRVRASRKNSM